MRQNKNQPKQTSTFTWFVFNPSDLWKLSEFKGTYSFSTRANIHFIYIYIYIFLTNSLLSNEELWHSLLSRCSKLDQEWNLCLYLLKQWNIFPLLLVLLCKKIVSAWITNWFDIFKEKTFLWTHLTNVNANCLVFRRFCEKKTFSLSKGL